jgi:hypothetical protein
MSVVPMPAMPKVLANVPEACKTFAQNGCCL